jgi:hypothetical protein
MSCASWSTYGGSSSSDSPASALHGYRSPMNRRGSLMNDRGSSTNAKIDRPMTAARPGLAASNGA